MKKNGRGKKVGSKKGGKHAPSQLLPQSHGTNDFFRIVSASVSRQQANKHNLACKTPVTGMLKRTCQVSTER